jgi:hypothetical protein
MKVTITFKHALNDRPLVIAWLVLFLTSLIMAGIFATQIHPSELNISNRYTAFGVTHVYNDSWYYLLGFILFIIVSVGVHTLITLKLLSQRGATLARLFMYISLIMVVIEYFLINAVLGIASISQ